MKKLSLICLLAFLFCATSCAWAETTDTPQDFAILFENMSIDELTETQELLKSILNEKIVANATLHLSHSEANIATGKTLKLDLTCDGREITKKTVVTYESSDETVATVSKGTVKGVNAGDAVITATATFEDGGMLTAQCAVTVYVPVNSVKVTTKSLSLLVGRTADLRALSTVAPETATEQGLSFTIDDPEVATLEANGLLTAQKAGSATITVTSNEQIDKPKSATIKVNVLQPVASIDLDATTFDVGRNASHRLACTISPSDASNQKVVWSSADPKIAKVSSNGVVTGVGTGTTTITCTSTDGSEISASATVTVITAVKKVAFAERSVSLTAGKRLSISATVTPQDATNPSLHWSSSNTAVATVSSSGIVTAISSGECIITAQAVDGSEAKASMTIYVEPQLPLVINSIYWQTTWGWKNGRMGVEAESLCVNRKIKSFDYTVKCYNYSSSTPVTTYLTYSGPTINPEKTGKSKLSEYSVGGFATAYLVEITPTTVYYTDGTSEDIPEAYQYTSSFNP